MKARLCTLILSFIIGVSICLYSSFYVKNTMHQLNDMRAAAFACAKEGNTQTALQKTRSMIEFIEKRSDILEMLTPHEDLHALTVQLTDAYTALSIGDLDDYAKAIKLMEEELRHLIAHESLTLSNIF